MPRALGLLLALLALCAVSPAAQARPGDLDGSWGEKRGYTLVDTDTNESAGSDVLMGPGGTSVIAGTARRPDGSDAFAVTWLSRRGKPRRTTYVSFSPEFGYVDGPFLASDGAGRLLLAGTANDRTGLKRPILARLLADGSLDTSFGDGGRLRLDVVGRSVFTVGLAVADGRRFVALSVNGRAVVAALDEQGNLTPGFGTGGISRLEQRPPDGFGADGRGRVVFSWRMPAKHTRKGRTFAFTRLTTAGAPDPSYGSGGTVAFRIARPIPASSPHDLFVHGDGMVTGVGIERTNRGRRRLVVYRVGTDGRLVKRFGRGGITPLRHTNDAAYRAALTLDNRGRVLLAAEVDYNEALVVRLSPTGGLDRSFGRRGIFERRVGFYDGISPRAIAARGRRIVVAGTDGYDDRVDYGSYIGALALRG